MDKNIWLFFLKIQQKFYSNDFLPKYPNVELSKKHKAQVSKPYGKTSPQFNKKTFQKRGIQLDDVFL